MCIRDSATTEKRIRGMISLRELTRNLIELQLHGGTDENIKAAQEKLNQAYDAYTAEYGLLNSTGNKRAFEQDSSYCLLCSLELSLIHIWRHHPENRTGKGQKSSCKV